MPVICLKLGALLKAHTNIYHHISKILYSLWCKIQEVGRNKLKYLVAKQLVNMATKLLIFLEWGLEEHNYDAARNNQ